MAQEASRATSFTTGFSPSSPSDHEQNSYFAGLGSHPRLVARTGQDIWPPGLESGETTPKKFFERLQDEDFVSTWSRQSEELNASILVVLEGCSWLHFFPVRIAYDKWRMTPALGSSIVLLVGMEGQMGFKDAYRRVTACKRALFRFGINIEVELYETKRHWYGDESGQEAKRFWQNVREDDLDPRFWHRVTENESIERHGPINGILSPLTHSSMSYPIVSLCGVVGSMGAHLKLEGSDKLYGLTCRHVAMGIRENVDRGEYVHVPNSREWDRRDIKTPTRTAEDVVEKLEAVYSRVVHSAAGTPGCVLREYIEKLPDATTLGCSTIGHVVLSPPLSAGHGGYLEDWALVELDEPANLHADLGNKIWVENEEYPWTAKAVVEARPSQPSCQGRKPMICGNQFREDSNGFMALREIIPVGKILQKSVRVAIKGGSKSQLAYGFTSEIPAIVRLDEQADNTMGGLFPKSKTARQVVVIPPHFTSGKDARQRDTFAQPGDSGSMVFDGQGNMIGMVGGGAMGPGILMDAARHLKPEHEAAACLVCDKEVGHDVSFVNPMETIVLNVEARTGRKVSFCK